jgi:hypothetical protein
MATDGPKAALLRNEWLNPAKASQSFDEFACQIGTLAAPVAILSLERQDYRESHDNEHQIFNR